MAVGERVRELGYRGVVVANGLASGFSLVGDLGPWHLWTQCEEPKDPAPDLHDIYTGMRERLPRLVEILRRSKLKDVRSIWAEAVEQEDQGILGPAVDLDDCPAEAMYIRRFRNESGRSCDDGSDGPGGNAMNAFTVGHDRLVLPGPESNVATVAAHSVFFNGDEQDNPWGSKDDLKGAYKQFKAAGLELFVLLLHPETREVCARKAFTLLFGEVSAVYIFLRIVAAICFILHCDFAVPAEAFFDDFWHWSPKWTAAGSTACLHFFFDLVGLIRKDEKYVSPRPKLPLLGLAISLRRCKPYADTIVIEKILEKSDRYVEQVRAIRAKSDPAGELMTGHGSKLAHIFLLARVCMAMRAPPLAGFSFVRQENESRRL